MATVAKDRIEDAIEDVVRKRIRSVEIVKVIVDRRPDDAGDERFFVSVIFDDKGRSLDSAETSRVTRHVWKRLINMQAAGFPSLSFIARAEAGKLAAA